MNESSRFWLAAALAPLSVPAWYVLASFFSEFGFSQAFVGYFAAIIAVSYMGFVLIGLPIALFLRYRDNLTYLSLFVSSMLAGPLFLVFMQLISGEPVIFDARYAQVAISFTALSTMVAMVFGKIARVKMR